MFTPPPSPLPTTSSFSPPPPVTDSKRLLARRTRLTVIILPLILILITLSTHYIGHPAAFDIFSEPGPDSWRALVDRAADWTVHRGHVHARRDGLDDPAVPTKVLAASSETLPTVPASPPVLPTPFPQPFDSDVYQNFSTSKCEVFFNNMTNVASFRSCRPFSLLLQSSSEFINAQSNLTLLNNIIWGTCNTSEDEAQCINNMDWFATELQTQCESELKNRHSLVVDTLTALHAYSLMRSAACLTDPSLNAYCFVSATMNSDLSDFLFYTLPLGIPLPKTASPTCSPCVKSLLGRYAAGLTSDLDKLSALARTYADAADLTRKTCGTTYATTVAAAMSTQNGGHRQQVFFSTLLGASVLAVSFSSGLCMLW